MKKHAKNNLRLGIFVSIALFLLIAGLYFIGSRQQLFGSTFRVHGIFKDISGLQVGNNVRFSGLTVGTVEDITQVNDSSVMVDMLIDADSRKFIKKDAKAIIGSDGLMGNKIVVISPGSGNKEIIQDGGIIQTAVPINMDDILSKLKITSDNAANITSNLSSITDNIREGKGTIGMLLMDTTFSSDLAAAMKNIRAGAGGFKQNMDAASKSFLLRGHIRDQKKNKDQK
jgi:phospholipid/cholesterol/gamma-HCH transport system substrate-binding protein